MMRRLLALALLMTTAAAPIKPDTATAVLMDGKCEDATWARARAHDMGQGTTVKFAADRDFVWMCITPPAQSSAILDLYLGDATGRLHNLHASTQLGERVRGREGWPRWIWWNHRDWYSNPIEFNGDRNRVSFQDSAAREVQIARTKFPGRTWTLMARLQMVGPDNAEAIFPTGANVDDPSTWATLTL